MITRRGGARAPLLAAFALALASAGGAAAQSVYHPITPSRADRTVTLTGRDLTI